MENTLSDPSGSMILKQGMRSLQSLLGQEWQVVERIEPDTHTENARSGDAVIQVRASDGSYMEFLVEVKRQVTPKDVKAVLLPKARLLQQVNSYTKLLVMAPWISRQTQQALRDNDISYLDLTSNVWLRVNKPAIVVHTQGADRAPHGHRSPSKKPLLTGPKAGRLVRLLADVAPPYRASDLCGPAGLSLPYVSRLLDALEDQLLVRREGRAITFVDWPNMLRLRAEHLNVLRHNSPVGMLAPSGLTAVFDQLEKASGSIAGHHVLLTGSYAARTVAPLSVGGQLMLYVHHSQNAPYEVGQELGLLPVDDGADVLMLRAHDRVVFERPGLAGKAPRVALSQLALDCLSGPGRMPAEGEAVIDHMAQDEGRWRLTSLSDLDQHQRDSASAPHDSEGLF